MHGESERQVVVGKQSSILTQLSKCFTTWFQNGKVFIDGRDRHESQDNDCAENTTRAEEAQNNGETR